MMWLESWGGVGQFDSTEVGFLNPRTVGGWVGKRLLRSFLGLDSETATLIMIRFFFFLKCSSEMDVSVRPAPGRIHEIFDIRCSYSGPRSGAGTRTRITGAVLRSLIAGIPERKKKGRTEGRKNEKKDKEREREREREGSDRLFPRSGILIGTRMEIRTPGPSRRGVDQDG